MTPDCAIFAPIVVTGQGAFTPARALSARTTLLPMVPAMSNRTATQRLDDTARRLDTAADRLSTDVIHAQTREFWHDIRAAIVAPFQSHRRP